MKGRVFLCCLLAFGCAAGAKGVVIAEGGRTDYAIVVSDAATPTDRFAAEELKTFLGESTGAEFPIVVGERPGAKTIEVGTARARRIIGESRCAKLTEEDSVYVITDEGTVAIVGAGTTGNAYGAYAFLERELGCRWLTLMGENLVPRHPTLDLRPHAHREKPVLPYRQILCMGLHWKADSSDHLFLFRNRHNMGAADYRKLLRKDLEGKLVPRMPQLSPGCHSFFFYMPPKDTKDRKGYFANHPDWYTMDTKGKRVPEQLCFASRGLRDELTRNFLARARQQGGVGFIDLSMQDDTTDRFCNCPGCLALEKKYGTPGGPFFDFLIELGPKVKRELPGILIHFLAYRQTQTQHPPKIKVNWPDNVAAMFAPIDNDFSKPFDHGNNAKAYEDLVTWGRLGKTWMWYYPITYAPERPPFGSLERTWADTRLALKAGLDGSFYEHDVGTNQGLNFADLQTWMLLQHFRDPDRDWRELRREFCDAYYGPASPDMIAYSDELEELVRTYPKFLQWHLPMKHVYTPERLARWNRSFDAMERKAGGDTNLVQRIREVRLGLDMQTMIDYRVTAKARPGALASPAVIYARALSTLTNAVNRRYDYPPSAPTFRKTYFNQIERQLNLAHVFAEVEPKPLPKEFAGIPEDRIRQVIAERARNGRIVRVKDDDAATGYALYEKDAPPRMPFPVVYRDFRAKENLASLQIPQDRITSGKYAFYKIGRVPIPNESCQIVLGASWWMTVSCEKTYIPGNDSLWDLWVSLRFDESSVRFDRAVFVGPYPKN